MITLKLSPVAHKKRILMKNLINVTSQLGALVAFTNTLSLMEARTQNI